MAVTGTVIAEPGAANPQSSMGDVWSLFASLAFTGSYATGGDAFDPSLLFSGPANVTTILVVDVSGGAGYGVEYDRTNKKLKVFSAAGTELAAGAYPAALTGDVNVVCQVFAR